jgi:hypothetical protein
MTFPSFVQLLTDTVLKLSILRIKKILSGSETTVCDLCHIANVLPALPKCRTLQRPKIFMAYLEMADFNDGM